MGGALFDMVIYKNHLQKWAEDFCKANGIVLVRFDNTCIFTPSTSEDCAFDCYNWEDVIDFLIDKK